MHCSTWECVVIVSNILLVSLFSYLRRTNGSANRRLTFPFAWMKRSAEIGEWLKWLIVSALGFSFHFIFTCNLINIAQTHLITFKLYSVILVSWKKTKRKRMHWQNAKKDCQRRLKNREQNGIVSNRSKERNRPHWSCSNCEVTQHTNECYERWWKITGNAWIKITNDSKIDGENTK